MILGALRLFKSLSAYHYRMILITIIVPAIVPVTGPLVIACLAPGGLRLQVALYVAAFLVWSIIVVLAVASMVRSEKSEAKQMLTQLSAGLSGRISSLKEQHEDLSVDLRRDVENLEEVVKTTLSEELGVVLPPRPVSLSFRANAGSPTDSFNLTAVGGSKVARLRQWLRQTARGIWEKVYGKREVS